MHQEEERRMTKKAMLFTLNEHSQWLLTNAIKRTKSKTVDRALEFYHRPGPPGHFVETCDLPDDFPLDGITIYQVHTNKNQYDRIVDALVKAKNRIKEQDQHIEELLKNKKRFFGLWGRK
jgi:hypothetical protein